MSPAKDEPIGLVITICYWPIASFAADTKYARKCTYLTCYYLVSATAVGCYQHANLLT